MLGYFAKYASKDLLMIGLISSPDPNFSVNLISILKYSLDLDFDAKIWPNYSFPYVIFKKLFLGETSVLN